MQQLYKCSMFLHGLCSHAHVAWRARHPMPTPSLEPHTMADRRKKSLQKYHTDLRTGIIVSYFLPKLHREAGGFLTDVESETIAAKKSSGNVEQVDELIRVLLTKESKDFDYFCDVLEEEGHQSLSTRLKVAAGLSKRPHLAS